MTQTQSTSLGPAAPGPTSPDATASLSTAPLPSLIDYPLVATDVAAITPKPQGTTVTAGQPMLLAGPNAPAPANGQVIGVVHAVLADGRKVPAIRFQFSGNDHNTPPDRNEHTPPSGDSTPAPMHNDIAACASTLQKQAVWADRMACPDLRRQFAQLVHRSADSVVCNLLDDNLPLQLNAAILQHGADRIVAAVHHLTTLLSARQPVFVIGNACPDRVHQLLNQTVSAHNGRMIQIAEHYPAAAAPLLLHTLLDRQLQPGHSPVDSGVLLLDGAAALSIADCLLCQRPMLQVPMAILDHIHAKAHYVLATVGMPICDLLIWLNIDPNKSAICAGHPLRQVDLPPDAIVSASELHLHVMPKIPPTACGPCTRCGWCADYCPMALQPALIAEAAHQDDPRLAQQAGIDFCIECGICGSVCPSQLPLLLAIRKLKNT